MRLGRKGLGLLEVVIGAGILLGAIIGMMHLRSQFTKAIRTGSQVEDVYGVFEERAAFMRRRMADLGGLANLLRLYGSTTANLQEFDPFMDKDLNSLLGNVFPGVSSPETHHFAKGGVTIKYKIRLVVQNINSSTGEIMSTDVPYPNVSVRLREVGLLIVEMAATTESGDKSLGHRNVAFGL
jgi:hypothetical protein